MTDRDLVGEKARAFFEDLWKQGDPWELEGSASDQARYRRQLRILAGRRYGRVLEVGCAAGSFTRHLARVADSVVALDISPTAVARARAVRVGPGAVEFRAQNVMDYDPHAEGPWDLVVVSETVYYLGWLYSFFDVGWLAAQLFSATRGGGRLLLANTQMIGDDYLVRPWLIRTYHDLFRNVGYCLEAEELFPASKHGVEVEILISLFGKVSERPTLHAR